MLPYGTGNDGAQVFGWGSSPVGEQWMTDLESLMRDIILSSTEPLSLWTCIPDGEVYNAKGERIKNEILLTYYFNMGVDAVIGMAVEKNRTRRRCCNYIIYTIMGAYQMFWRGRDNRITDQIKQVVSKKQLSNGATAEKVVADMSKLKSSPFNIVGTNLTQCYGGFLNQQAWKKSKGKVMEPGKALRSRGLSVFETSCDESDSRLEQRKDDDKMELMCHEGITDYIDFEMSRYGQVRSPF